MVALSRGVGDVLLWFKSLALLEREVFWLAALEWLLPLATCSVVFSSRGLYASFNDGHEWGFLVMHGVGEESELEEVVDGGPLELSVSDCDPEDNVDVEDGGL